MEKFIQKNGKKYKSRKSQNRKLDSQKLIHRCNSEQLDLRTQALLFEDYMI